MFVVSLPSGYALEIEGLFSSRQEADVSPPLGNDLAPPQNRADRVYDTFSDVQMKRHAEVARGEILDYV